MIDARPMNVVACDHGQSFAFDRDVTALLCVDYQTDFLSAEGFCAARGLPVERLRHVIRPARAVQRATRDAGIALLHMRECYAPDLGDLNAYRRARDSIIGARGPLGRFLINGEPGTRIVPELAPLDGEAVIDKAGFSGFYRTPLDAMLREKGVTHLIIMGITTQVCVASTLRAAVDHGYHPLLLADCCAAYEQQHHDSTIEVVFSENHQFGWVSDSRRYLAALDASP
jgi:nicotinamidase-related amidase